MASGAENSLTLKKKRRKKVMSRRIFAAPTSRRRKSTVHGFSNRNPRDEAETVPEGEKLPLLQCRCLLSNFARKIENWELNGREWELLRTTPFGNLTEGILKLKMNAEIVDALLGFWNEDHCGFEIGGSIVPFTADDIALITGLPNRGRKIVRQRVSWKDNTEFCRIYMSLKHIEQRLDGLLQGSRNNPNSETDKCFVQQMILYLWGSVLFPSSSRTVPVYMSLYVRDLATIGNYNWAEKIHSFLVKEMNFKSRVLKQRNEGKKVTVGYMNGLCFAINAWFFEHVDFGEDSRPSNPDIRPRMLKWVEGCKLWKRKPFLQRFREIVKDKVSYHILPKKDELELLSLEVVGNSAERIKAGKHKYFDIQCTNENYHKQNERISLLERKVIILERLALSNGWKIQDGLNDVDDLGEHKDGEVDEEAHGGKIDSETNEQVVCQLNEAFFPGSCDEGDKGLAAERIGQTNLIEIDVKQGGQQHGKRKVLKLPLSKEHLVLKRRNTANMKPSTPTMRSSTRFWRKDNVFVNLDDYAAPIKQKKETKVAPLNYVGRELLTENERNYLDAFCIKPMQRDDIVFFDWNIAIRRHSMVEYLHGGYTGEEIIDAYARLLFKRDKMFGDKFASFLYVPPMFLGLYRNKLGSYKTFLSSIDKKSLEKVKFLFLPCLIPTANHWLLLVCDMEVHKWTVYDSLYDPRHRGAAKEQIMLLSEYLYQDHGFDIRAWGLEYRRIYPQQEPGTLDCGIFVMKFIENIIHVPRTIDFQGTDMQLFRPQIAYRILCQC